MLSRYIKLASRKNHSGPWHITKWDKLHTTSPVLTLMDARNPRCQRKLSQSSYWYCAYVLPLKLWQLLSVHDMGVTGKWQAWSPNLTSRWPWRCCLDFCGIVAGSRMCNPPYLKLFDDFDTCSGGIESCAMHYVLPTGPSVSSVLIHANNIFLYTSNSFLKYSCCTLFHLLWNHCLSIIYSPR